MAAQDTFTTARDSAVQAHGEGDQADRAAFTALKEKFEKRGDHWIAKRDRRLTRAARGACALLPARPDPGSFAGKTT
jgi:ChaB protein